MSDDVERAALALALALSDIERGVDTLVVRRGLDRPEFIAEFRRR